MSPGVDGCTDLFLDNEPFNTPKCVIKFGSYSVIIPYSREKEMKDVDDVRSPLAVLYNECRAGDVKHDPEEAQFRLHSGVKSKRIEYK